MKKILAIAGMIIVAAAAFANGARETETLEGKLSIVDSVPTLTVGAESYALPPGPFYQVAWENGLKAGDTLKVEGYVFDGPDDADEAGMIVPTKAWANGKALDLSTLGKRRLGPGMRGGLWSDGDGPGLCDNRDGRRDRRVGCDRDNRRGRGDGRGNRKSGAGKN